MRTRSLLLTRSRPTCRDSHYPNLLWSLLHLFLFVMTAAPCVFVLHPRYQADRRSFFCAGILLVIVSLVWGIVFGWLGGVGELVIVGSILSPCCLCYLLEAVPSGVRSARAARNRRSMTPVENILAVSAQPRTIELTATDRQDLELPSYYQATEHARAAEMQARAEMQQSTKQTRLQASRAANFVARAAAAAPSLPRGPRGPRGPRAKKNITQMAGADGDTLLFTFQKPTVASKCGLVFRLTSVYGARVDSLDPDGAAAGCGLQHGDVVVSINKRKVKSAAQAETMLLWLKGEVKVEVKRRRADAAI